MTHSSIKESKYSGCTDCDLCKTRKQVVLPAGPQTSNLLIIGEAPGESEDNGGEPFVGRSGRLLTDTLHSVGVMRNEVRIINTVWCRPPDNRDPTNDEVRACNPKVIEAIENTTPKVILTLGKVATKMVASLPGVKEVSKDPHLFEWGERRIISTWHPAYCLYRPKTRPRFEADVGFAVDLAFPTRVEDDTVTQYFDDLFDSDYSDIGEFLDGEIDL